MRIRTDCAYDYAFIDLSSIQYLPLVGLFESVPPFRNIPKIIFTSLR